MDDEDSIKKTIENYLHKIERYIEKRSGINLIISLAIVIFGILITFHDLMELYKDSPRIISPSILLVILCVVLAIDYKRTRILNKRKNQIIDLEKDVKNLRRLIWTAANLKEPEYDIVLWNEIHDIRDNSDVIYTRKCKIKCGDNPEYWFILGLSIIEGDLIESLKSLNISAKSLDNGKRLSWAPAIIKPEQIKLAIVLDPYLNPGEETGVEVILTWRGAYKELLTHLEDEGGVVIKRPTEQIKIEFILPAGYQFRDFIIRNKIGSFEIKSSPRGRSLLVFEAKYVPMGDYNYKLFCDLIG